MTINPDLLAQLEHAKRQIQQSHDAVDAIRQRMTEESAAPEVLAYLDGLYELLTVTADATRNVATALQQEFGEGTAKSEYQY